MEPFSVTRGDSCLILTFPHSSTYVPPEVHEALNARGRNLTDTDWHLDRLYEGLLPDVTVVKAGFHRYAIDANRDPSGASLYPGQNTTGLCPLTDFDGEPIYQAGREPDAAEIDRRRLAYHAPYHAAIAAEIERIRARHGVVMLYDCHSIRSHIPFLFDGTLPDFNLGTDNGKTCAASMEGAAKAVCAAAPGFTHVVNGRFRGGWTVRHYGRQHEGDHAFQMELAQSNYLETEALPFAYSPARAERIRPYLRAVLSNLVAQAHILSQKA